MKRLEKYSALLNAVQTADPKTRVGILRSAPDEFIKTLLEVVLNVLAGNVHCQGNQLKRVKRYKSHLREVSHCRHNIKQARKKLIQRGGFLPLILPLLGIIGKGILGAAAGAAAHATINKIRGR
jgi:hypothetical protein